VLLQDRTGPLPDTPHIRLAAKLTAFASYGDGMPVFEARVRIFEVDEEIVWIDAGCGASVTVRQRFGWWRLVNTIVDEVPVNVSSPF
jgi:hypothetical protein